MISTVSAMIVLPIFVKQITTSSFCPDFRVSFHTKVSCLTGCSSWLFVFVDVPVTFCKPLFFFEARQELIVMMHNMMQGSKHAFDLSCLLQSNENRRLLICMFELCLTPEIY